MYLFGLTGGISSGKSTVSEVLSELGCPIIDADIIARQGKFHCHIKIMCMTIFFFQQII